MSDDDSDEEMENVKADARKIMSTEVLNDLPSPTQSKGQQRLQLPGSQSPHLFMNAPFMKVKPSGTSAGTPLEFVSPMEGIPPGLEYLAEVDHLLFVNQSIDISDDVVGFFKATNWHLNNSKGQRLYVAAESKYRRKTCCPTVESRPFNISVLDSTGGTVLKITRPVTCALCWWGGDSCGSVVSIFDGDDNLIGYVNQNTNPCITTYEIFNSLNQKIFNVRSNKCKCWYTKEKNEFEIYRFHPTGTSTSTLKDNKILLGKIKKNWSGFSDYTSADTFGIKFPADMEIIQKAILIGVVFLVDFQFFEARDGKCTGCWLFILSILLSILLFMLVVVIIHFTSQ